MQMPAQCCSELFPEHPTSQLTSCSHLPQSLVPSTGRLLVFKYKQTCFVLFCCLQSCCSEKTQILQKRQSFIISCLVIMKKEFHEICYWFTGVLEVFCLLVGCFLIQWKVYVSFTKEGLKRCGAYRVLILAVVSPCFVQSDCPLFHGTHQLPVLVPVDVPGSLIGLCLLPN